MKHPNMQPKQLKHMELDALQISAHGALHFTKTRSHRFLIAPHRVDLNFSLSIRGL